MTAVVGAPTLTPPVTDNDHVVGPSTAPVTLVEYGDYECPYCGMAQPVVHEVRRELGRNLRFAFRHFPLTRVHPHAEHAAEAAEAASAQGESFFWQMHESLFEDQSALDDDSLLARAKALGLDVRRFAHELATGVHTPTVQAHFLSGVRSGVNGTPTFFINGYRYDGPRDVPSLLAALTGG